MNKKTAIKKIAQIRDAQYNISEYIADLRVLAKFLEVLTSATDAERLQLQEDIKRARLAKWKLSEYADRLKEIAFSMALSQFTVQDLIIQ